MNNYKDSENKKYEEDVLSGFDKIKESFSRPPVDPNKQVHIVPNYDPIGLNITVSSDTPVSQQIQDAVAKNEAIQAASVTPGRAARYQKQSAGRSKASAAKAKAEEQAAAKAKAEARQAAEREKAEAKLQAKAEAKEAAKAEKLASKQAKKSKKKKKGKKKRGLFGKILLRFAILCICLVIVGCCAVGVVVLRIMREAPEIDPNNIYGLLSENSIIYDADGNIIENVYSGDSLRTNIAFDDMPEDLVNAFVAIEDKTFWEHSGFNYVRIVGAIVQKVTGKSEKIGGTSTITQQLARNLFLSETKSERSMVRKITEAYYTIILEQSLTKEQILEAYINTIYLGFNCDGVAAAAQAYFSKDVSELNLVECATLAALPQSPNNYAPLKRYSTASITDFESLDIVSKDETWTVVYNSAGESRYKTVLYNMYEQGKITEEEYNSAKVQTVRSYLNPGSTAVSQQETTYFVDYVKNQVLADLQTTLNIDLESARDMLYNGGLRIYSTMKSEIQDIVNSVYSDPANFPAVGTYATDENGNILDSKNEEKIVLYSLETYFSEDGSFILSKDEYSWLPDGSLKLYYGKRMNFYRTYANGITDYTAEFKNLYEIVDGVFYSRNGGTLNINYKYKTRDENYNLIIDSSFFTDHPDFFIKQEDGSLKVIAENYTLKQQVMQPQSAMVIKDYTTGGIVAMIGGRNISGQYLYNRATSTRQPGSSIKPLAVYSVALQTGVNEGGTFTAASPIDDIPSELEGELWPSNWYSGYKGRTNLRYAVQQSINACSVQLFKQLDSSMSVEFLQGMGITSIVTSGTNNDINESALALGGMTYGVSPLEMAGAYGTIANYGTYVETICYTKVTTKNGDVLIDNEPYFNQVMDVEVASLMTNILQSVVENGLAKGAKLTSQPSAGKTGTTNEKYDIWFCGYTPQYSCSCWIGNDVNIALSKESSAATKLWKAVMEQVGALYEREEFVMEGEFVTCTVDKHSGKLWNEETGDPDCALTEIFIAGTEPTEYDDSHLYVAICDDSGYLATPYCTDVHYELQTTRPGGQSWEEILSSFVLTEAEREVVGLDYIPDAYIDAVTCYCPIHNYDTETYHVSAYTTGEYVGEYYFDEEELKELLESYGLTRAGLTEYIGDRILTSELINEYCDSFGTLQEEQPDIN